MAPKPKPFKAGPKTSDGDKQPKFDKKSRPPKAKTEIKTRRPTASGKDKLKKKRKIYTAEQLGIPKLNGIIPAGVQKARGKKGKVFVDDAGSMLAILGMVQAEKEGEREGKIMKAVSISHCFWELNKLSCVC
jgi:60S ribosomal subunit assembly/export protein LOC1